MTIKDLHINFGLELDKTQDFEYPSFSPEQIDYWLNKAQDVFIENTLYPKGKEANKEGFEVTQQDIDELSDIVIISAPIAPIVTGTTSTITLPNDYRHLIRHRCTTLDTTCGVKEVSGIQIRQNSINTRLKDPFWKPRSDSPLYYLYGGKLIYEKVIGFSITNAILTYIKNPVKMALASEYVVPGTDIQPEFKADYILRRILDLAVSMVLENIESQRYQTNLNELNKNS